MALIAEQWGRLVWWLNQNAGAFQAATAVFTAFLTWRLVAFTRRSVTATDAALEISRQQARASSQPQVLIRQTECKRSPQGVFSFRYEIVNAGELYFQINRIEIKVHCGRAEHTVHEPMEFPAIHRQVVPGKDVVPFAAEIKPNELLIVHEPDHEGECYWNFEVEVAVQDLFDSAEHVFRWSDGFGLRYSRPYVTFTPEEIDAYLSRARRRRLRKSIMSNRIFRYSPAWLQSRISRLLAIE